MRPTATASDVWHQYTCRGNTVYQLGGYGNAILMHNQALDHARHQFARQDDSVFGQILSKVLISHFSLADCYRALEQPRRAASCYLEALRFLRGAAQELPATQDSLDAVLQAGTHLHTLWCEFAREFPNIPDNIALEYHAASQALCVTLTQHAVHH